VREKVSLHRSRADLASIMKTQQVEHLTAVGGDPIQVQRKGGIEQQYR